MPPAGIAVQALQTLSDGTVAIFYSTYVNPSKDMTTDKWSYYLSTFRRRRHVHARQGVTSTCTVGTPRSGAPSARPHRRSVGFDAAVDTRSTKYRDRMYMLYAESRRPDEVDGWCFARRPIAVDLERARISSRKTVPMCRSSSLRSASTKTV